MNPNARAAKNPDFHSARHRRGSVAGAALTILLGLLLLFLERALPLDTLSNDVVFALRKHHVIPQEAIIVYLDETSLAVLQPQGDRLSRRHHAKLIDQLKKAGARAVVFDILFYGPSDDAEADQQFARSIREHGRVILAGENLRVQSDHDVQAKLFEPYAPFKEAAAGWGLVQLAIEQEYAVRRHLHNDTDRVPSLSWATASLLDSPRLSRGQSETRWINYYGSAGELPNISYHLALEENGPPPGFFRDKVVFVGAKPTAGYTGAAKDEFKTPLTFWTGRYAPGVEIHATCFLNLMRGDWLHRLGSLWQLALVIGVGLGAGYGLVNLRPLTATAFTIASMIGLTVVACWLGWHFHITFSWLVLVIQCGAALLWAIIFNSVHWYVQREFMLKTLSTHLSPARAKVLMGKPELLRPGADLQTVSILFSDIADFSSISAKLPPNILAELLNKYFETSISSIQKTEGTVIKLIGDAIFAIWNAPIAQTNHQELACRAALLLREQLLQFDAENREVARFHTRVGLHTGVACVGNFGSAARFDYTAIGDNVNLSSRLEGLNKFLGTTILLSDAMHAPVQDLFDVRSVGRFQLKGMSRHLEVFELLGLKEQSGVLQAWRNSFASALAFFQRKDFTAAEVAFRETLAARANDGPSVFYLERLQEFRVTQPPVNWHGEIELHEK